MRLSSNLHVKSKPAVLPDRAIRRQSHYFIYRPRTVLKGMTPIVLKLEEVVKQYTLKVKQQQQAINLDHDVEHKYWPHPAKVI